MDICLHLLHLRINITNIAKNTGAVVTVEEHQVTGGLGGAIAECLGENYPVPARRVGIMDTFGESGEPNQLLEKFGLTSANIIKSVKDVLKVKK